MYYLLWSHLLQSRCSTNGVTGGGHVSFWVFQFWKHYKLLFFDNEKESEKNNKTPFGSSISNLFDHLLIIFTETTVFLFVNCQ